MMAFNTDDHLKLVSKEIKHACSSKSLASSPTVHIKLFSSTNSSFKYHVLPINHCFSLFAYPPETVAFMLGRSAKRFDSGR
jgi:hypothetical protein